MSSWLAEAAAVLAKEWRSESRTRVALSSVLLFATTTLFVVSIAVGPIGGAPMIRPIMPVLLWIILLFATSAGLPRTFVHEEEVRTADALRLAGSPSAVFAGKALYNLALVLVLEALVTPLFLGLLGVDVERPLELVWMLLAGGLGLAVGSTLIAAIVAQAQVRGTLFAVLAFPILLPLLKLAVDGSVAAMLGEPAGATLTLTFLYDGVLIVAGAMLFPLIWNP
ncbi:MAG: heme exporter protein CcmB [Acidobacteriota bacterium]